MTTRDRIPVTAPARTLLDLASVLPRRALEHTIEVAERHRLCGVEELVAITAAHPTRRGSGLMRRVLAEHKLGSTMTRNDLEEVFLTLCDTHALPRPEVNVPIGRYEADFFWREARLIVETDGRESHGTRAALRARPRSRRSTDGVGLPGGWLHLPAGRRRRRAGR